MQYLYLRVNCIPTCIILAKAWPQCSWGDFKSRQLMALGWVIAEDTPRLVAAGEKISLVPHQQAENAFSLADVSVAGCGFTFGVVVRFGLCLAKHNEQYLPVLSFSNAPQAKKSFGCCVFCKQRD